MDRLRHYDFDVNHISGKDNLVADFLSRPGESEEPSEVPTLPDDDYIMVNMVSQDSHIPLEDFIAASQTDLVLPKLRNYIRSGWPTIKKIFVPELRHSHKNRHELSKQDSFKSLGEIV